MVEMNKLSILVLGIYTSTVIIPEEDIKKLSIYLPI